MSHRHCHSQSTAATSHRSNGVLSCSQIGEEITDIGFVQTAENNNNKKPPAKSTNKNC